MGDKQMDGQTDRQIETDIHTYRQTDADRECWEEKEGKFGCRIVVKYSLAIYIKIKEVR